VDLFGPTDLTTMYNTHPFPQAAQPILQNFLGATPTTNAALYADASPVNFVNGQSVPTQIFHGQQDIVVPIAQSTALKNKLQTANVKVEMVVYPNEGHGWYGPNLLDTYAKATAFIKQNVQ
jgi:dipeptidyl aminopeptidase/acylaminoacyl peptidase